MEFSRSVLQIDVASEIASITTKIRKYVFEVLRKKGAVVAVSGGVDSAVCASLCVRALERQNVAILLLPERDSTPLSLRLGLEVASSLGVMAVTEDITKVLETVGCYVRQIEAIRQVFPEYDSGWKHKISLPSILKSDRLNVSSLTVQSPSGQTTSARMPLQAYLQLVAATNFKQRTRTMISYYHADRLNYAVCGTPNRVEYDQGFFVKVGDGSSDLKPIAHLYKTQVYQIACAVGIPSEICVRPPTTDTYSLSQTQEEFYFALPYEEMDLCLYVWNHDVPASVVGPVLGLSSVQVERVFRDIDAKRRGTLPLHLTSLMMSPVEQISRMIQSAIESTQAT